MARTAPSGVIATSAPWLTLLFSPFCASSSVTAFSALAWRLGIDCCADYEVFVDMADDVVDAVHHPVGDIVDRAGAGLCDDVRRLCQRCSFARRADEAQFGHGGEHDFGAVFGAVEIARRRQPRRRLDEAGEQRGFRKRYLSGRLAEIALRRLFDAVGAGAEIDPVQIQFENLRLGDICARATAPAASPAACA